MTEAGVVHSARPKPGLIAELSKHLADGIRVTSRVDKDDRRIRGQTPSVAFQKKCTIEIP